MERYDNHAVSEAAQNMKVPFFKSIRMRILLLAIVPILFSILSIGLLTNVSIKAMNDIKNTANQQTSLYQNLTLSNTLYGKLTTYLNSSDSVDLEDYQIVRQQFADFLEELHLISEQQPYSQSLFNIGKTYLQLSDTAAENLSNETAMIASYQEVQEIQELIASFVPYVTKELETMFSEQTTAIINHMMTNIGGYVLLLAFILLTLIFIAAITAGSIITPLSALTDAVRSVSLSTDTPFGIHNGLQNELGILIGAYNDMVKRIRTQLAELEDKQKIERMLQAEKEKNLKTESLLTRSELNFYQSQINSHFLFNAFNMVSRLAYIEHAPQVQHAVSLIAQFLRNILTQYDRNITVEEEFAIVNNFTDIQQLRFGDRIHVESFIDPDVEWFIIPALTLQPLIENAYCHGLSNRKQGFIRYAAELTENIFHLYVWDDGEGISPERQKEIYQYIESENKEELSNCIGLRNVYHRLNLLYPGKVSLQITSEVGVYTQIGFLITMP